jgi:AP-1-like factor
MSSSNAQYNRDLYLSPNQQDLLLAALSSNNPQPSGLPNNPQVGQSRNSANSRSPQVGQQNNMGNGQLFDSPIQQTPGSGNFLEENSPFLDYEDADGSFDFDFSGAQMIGDLPDGSNGSEEGDLHDKRKSIDGKTDDDEGGGKRRESDDKSAKKPGRKPLTSEPTSVDYPMSL